MIRFFFIAIILITTILVSAFFNPEPNLSAKKVKQYYLQQTDSFIKAATALQYAVKSGNEKKMQLQFFKTRIIYKQIETIAEYYFNFYAIKLNGPPIPFFEEDEADIPENNPYGMQVIESLIFPHYKPENKSDLKIQVDELVRLAIELPTINESFEFGDDNIFDAFMEEMYRITALGITGFDSQTAQNFLPECAAALNSLQHYLSFYKTQFNEKLPGKYGLLENYLTAAQVYIEGNKMPNSFNRMEFITAYLNPIAKIVGEFKVVNKLKDNPAGFYYSGINKNNSLFNPGAFNPYRFLDDFSTSAEKIELGRMLFFETGLSSNNQRSCATCHNPGKAFTDGLKTSLALDGHSPLPRNAPTLWNAALQRNLFADSRSRNLEEQVMQVLNNALEMHGAAQTVAENIVTKNKYKDIYQKAYPGSVTGNAAQNICNAIACYERTLIALNSRFDKHMNGQNTLTANEINGFNIFMGKAKCGTCHFMPLFSGAKPPRYYYIESEVIGVPKTNAKRNSKLDSDSGRYNATQAKIHLFAFKTPTLRNIELTAPYMHNGVFNSLEEVVEFYNNGGGKGLGIAPPNQSLPFEKLQLSVKEQKDIIAFMKTLSDTTGRY